MAMVGMTLIPLLNMEVNTPRTSLKIETIDKVMTTRSTTHNSKVAIITISIRQIQTGSKIR
jgi:hypothetical protein